jgi:transcriptional regulator with XRE-family HTH domain
VTVTSALAESEASDGDAQRDYARRRRLAAFLLERRQGVKSDAQRVGPYARRDNRVGRPFTQEEVAEALDVSRQWYAALEMGSSIRPSTALVERIATLYALDADERVTLLRLAIREFAPVLGITPKPLNDPQNPTPFAAALRSPAAIDEAAYRLADIRERYHLTGACDGAPARPRIVHSWERCRRLAVEPTRKRAPIRDDLAERRERNERLLRAADPVVMHLADQFTGTGYVIVVTDADGLLLDLAGDLDARRKLERIDFVRGGDWSEAAVGTNAIGTAIADVRPLQLLAAEHFCDAPLPFTCTAAPICAPGTREIVGVLDITGAYALVRPHLLGVVMQSALEIEERLALR